MEIYYKKVATWHRKVRALNSHRPFVGTGAVCDNYGTAKTMNAKRNIAVVIAAALIVGLAYYYRENLAGYLASKGMLPASGSEAVARREVSYTATFAVPDGSDIVTFSLFLDKEGVITDAKSVNKEDPLDANVLKFNAGLLTVIKGKKLSELGPVDKIGTSSLTTEAFNAALAKLKAQL